MTRILSKTTTRRIITSTLAALVLAAALPQVGFAASSDAGIWKVDAARSSFSDGSASLSITRAEGVNPAAGSFIAVSKGKVYLVTGAAASDAGSDVKQVDYSNIKVGSAVLIGTKARSTGACGFGCQAGLSQPRMTLSFKSVPAGETPINDMLAYDGQKKQ